MGGVGTIDDLTAPGALPDVTELAAIAERCQADPQRFCAYVGDDAASIIADVAEVVAGEHRLAIERSGDDGRVVGWLLGEIDREIDRTWWWGPFVDDVADWHQLADRLYTSATTGGTTTGEELAADDRSTLVDAFATRHGFAAREGSACLTVRSADLRVRPLGHTGDDGAGDDGAGDSAPAVTIVPLSTRHHDEIARLHEQLFPGSHTTGRGLVEPGGDLTRSPRLVAEVDGRPVGYVATEHQHDGSLYVDFVGVAPDATRRGIGRMLVASACRDGFERGASRAHLTVRTSNTAARALYRSLGFDEERVLVPYHRNVP